MKTSIKAVRKRIKHLLIDTELNYNSLSMKCGLPVSSIKSILYEKTKSTTLYTLSLICNGFGISLAEFFDDDLFKTKLDDDI